MQDLAILSEYRENFINYINRKGMQTLLSNDSSPPNTRARGLREHGWIFLAVCPEPRENFTNYVANEGL